MIIPNIDAADSKSILVEPDLPELLGSLLPNIGAADSIKILLQEEPISVLQPFFPNMFAADSIKILVSEEPIQRNYIWSVSVPSFVCTGPMYRRKV